MYASASSIAASLSKSCRYPPASVIIAERIQADVCLAPQAGVNDLCSQRKVRCVGPIHAFAPIALDRGHPTRTAISTILPAKRINIGARTEQGGRVYSRRRSPSAFAAVDTFMTRRRSRFLTGMKW